MVKNKDIDEEKVCVVMSTYNGEKYLEEQLDSLFNQTYSNVKIFVRDDGSNDRTIKILENYKKQGKLEFIKGKNLGYAKSFIETLKLAGHFDYYAFCVQDDVWLPNKLEEAIKKLRTKNLDKPLLYYSNLIMCDANLNYMQTIEFKVVSFANSLVETNSYGNTSVINKKLRDMIIKHNIINIFSHDGYVNVLANSLGEIVYDKNAYIMWRSHGNNTSIKNANFIKQQQWRIYVIKKFKNQHIEFYQLFKEDLKLEDKKLLELVVNKKYNLFIALKKCFYPHRFCNMLIVEILIRLFFLIGKI